jgi:glycosyltransferase involved in cell wall biosynthesis
LRDELGKQHDVEAEAYNNPFPKWLYPGQHIGDLRTHEDRLEDVHYDLSYHWPGAWSRVAKRIIGSKPDVVLIPWWTFFFAFHYASLVRRLHKAGIPAVFLCHNFFDHEASFWKNSLSLRALRLADGFVFHSSEEAELAQKLLPSIPSITLHHPTYDHLPHSDKTELPRERLELLFFGLVRPYKGLEDLVAALEKLDPATVRLTVAGEWWGQQEKLLSRCRHLEASGQLRLINRYLSDQETADLFAECHAVALPYRKATNSGVLAHAIEARKPVIATSVGALPSLVKDPESGAIVPPQRPDLLAAAIKTLAEKIASGNDFTPTIERIRQHLNWQNFSNDLTKFFAQIVREET